MLRHCRTWTETKCFNTSRRQESSSKPQALIIRRSLLWCCRISSIVCQPKPQWTITLKMPFLSEMLWKVLCCAWIRGVCPLQISCVIGWRQTGRGHVVPSLATATDGMDRKRGELRKDWWTKHHLLTTQTHSSMWHFS